MQHNLSVPFECFNITTIQTVFEFPKTNWHKIVCRTHLKCLNISIMRGKKSSKTYQQILITQLIVLILIIINNSIKRFCRIYFLTLDLFFFCLFVFSGICFSLLKTKINAWKLHLSHVASSWVMLSLIIASPRLSTCMNQQLGQ